MPGSTQTNTRTAHTTITVHSERTTRTRRSLLSAFTKTFATISESAPFFSPSHAYERSLSVEEEKLVRHVIAFLNPTILHPFDNFQRPWPKDKDHGFDHNKLRSERAILEQGLVQRVADFINDFPQSMSFENAGSSASPEVACVESMQLRQEGYGHQAVCVLQRALAKFAGSNNTLRLHKLDVLSQLRLHSPAVRRFDVAVLPSEGPVAFAILMFEYADQLLRRFPSYELIDIAVSDEARDEMLGEPCTGQSADEVYARICYSHTLITSTRFANVLDKRSALANIESSDKALAFLLGLWRSLASGLQVDHVDFLRWRCGQALNEILVFPDSSLDLPAMDDAFCNMARTTQSSSPGSIAAFKTWWNGGQVPNHHLSVLASHLEQVIRRRDTRSLDEALQAIQLIDHPDLTRLRQALRFQSWRLHREMLPESAWVLDSGLQHGLHLWVATRELQGAFHGVRDGKAGPKGGVVAQGQPAGEHWKCIPRLQFGFGGLSSKQDSRRWVYSWSILYHCLQYTSSALTDRLYSLLFMDSDLFSWSQACQRLRLICRTHLVSGYDCEDLLLDGVTPQHSNLAGLDSLHLPRFRTDLLSRLDQKIAGLQTLRREVQGLISRELSVRPLAAGDSEPSAEHIGNTLDGLNHLASLSLAWAGLARLEHAVRRFSSPNQESKPRAVFAGRQDILSEFLAARKDLEDSFKEGRQLQHALIIRQAGDGLLVLHDRIFDLETASTDDPGAALAMSRLALCEKLEDDLRSAAVETLSSQGYSFAAGDQRVSTQPPPDAVTELYQSAQTSLYSLERFEEAANWSQAETDDAVLAHTMDVMDPVCEERHWLSNDAPITMSPLRSPTARSLRDFLASTEMPNMPLPKEGRRERATEVVNLIRAIPTAVGPAKVIQFGYKAQHIVVYATNMTGKVRHTPCDISKTRLDLMSSTFRKAKAITRDEIDIFRQLDTLAHAIAKLTEPDELLIMIPGVLCRDIPLQALESAQGSNGMSLSERNPIIYAPTPYLVQRCVEKGLDGQLAATRQRRTTAAGVFENSHWTTAMESTARYIAKQLHGSAITGNDVTRERMHRAFQEREWVFFIGHGSGGLKADGGLGLPQLVLRGNEQYTQFDMAQTSLPNSCLVLLGCEFGKVRVQSDSEHQSMALTTLLAGSLATVGTMFWIYTDAAKFLGRTLADKLKPVLERSGDNTIFDLARALQQALKEMRSQHKKPEDAMGPEKWAPFVLHGTPLLLIGRKELQGPS